MLTKTLMHLPGVGAATERKLWAAGWHDWDRCLAGSPAELPRVLRDPVNYKLLEASRAHYEREQWRFFEQHLPATVKWRAFEPLRAQTLYVDIETDGITNAITVLGIYDGQRYEAYVADENLEAGLARLEAAAVVVTYNGTGFDMPIIRAHFPHNLFNHIHIDLMWPLRKLGYRGGLKSIEKQLGLARGEETATLSGWDAVWLWRQHRQGSCEARARLLAYNEEDVRNLEPLMEFVHARCCGGEP